MQPLVIYGAGGFAREVLALVADVNAAAPAWDVLGFLDDGHPAGGEVAGLPVLGGGEWLEGQQRPPHVVVAVGSPEVKCRMAARLRGRAAGFPVLRHPSAIMAPTVRVGQGTIITAGCVLTTDIVLHEFVTVNLLCTIGHDCSVGAFATLAPGVHVSGNVTVGEGCALGTGSALVQGVSVGEWAVLGAGAVVNRDVPANCTAVGVPAKAIKSRPAGWHLT